MTNPGQAGDKKSMIPEISSLVARGSTLLLKLPAWGWGLAFLGFLGLSSLGTGGGQIAHTDTTTSSNPDMLALGMSVLFKLGLVIVLIYVSMILFRRWRVSLPNRPERKIHILETARLSPRQAIHLVCVKDQLLLIGATDQGLSLLTELDGVVIEEERPQASPVSFEKRLGELFPIGTAQKAP